MTIATPANTSSTCLGTLSAPDGGTTISLSGGGVGGPSSCSISVDVTATATGTNTSGDLTSDPTNNHGDASATLTVDTGRPAFTKSFSPSTIPLGGKSTLTLTIDNSANASAVENLDFTDNLPTGMVVAGPANAATDCESPVLATFLTATPGTSVIILDANGTPIGGNEVLAAGATCTVTVDVVATAAGALNNVTGELISTNGVSSESSGSASAILTATVDKITLEKSFLDDPARPGGTVDLEFTVRNLSRTDSATSIAFTDALPAGLSLNSAPSNPCGTGSSISGTTTLSFSGGNLPPDPNGDPAAIGSNTCTFTVTLDVPSGASSGQFTNTTSTITADVGAGSETGAAASDIVVIKPLPIFTKIFNPSIAPAGGTVSIDFQIVNTSSTSSATSISFVDEFDVIFPTATSVPADGSACGGSSDFEFTPLNPMIMGSGIPAKLTLMNGELAAGASCNFSITLDVNPNADSGAYANTTSDITATVDAEVLVAEGASDTLEIVGGPSLTKTFTDDPAQPGLTVTLEFSLTGDEQAPGDATGITFTDDLTLILPGTPDVSSTGLPLNTACNGQGSLTDNGSGTLTFAGGILAPAETCTFSVTLAVPAGAPAGAHTNTTSMVSATVSGLSTVSDAASDDLNIAGLTLTKEFIEDPVLAGGQVTLRFTLSNISSSDDYTDIVFTDDIDLNLDDLDIASPLPDPVVAGCGALSLLTGVGNNLVFQNGALTAGTFCSFDVTIDVPGAAVADTYVNGTSALSAKLGGVPIAFDGANDGLIVADEVLSLAKEFLDDPVGPGENVQLSFTISNLGPSTISTITFTDDLDDALTGLVKISVDASLPACGASAAVSGTGLLVFTNGELAGGAECTFVVTLTVPGTTAPGTVATNTTGDITGNAGAINGGTASDDLLIDALEFTKEFLDTVDPGDTVGLRFTIENFGTDPVDDLTFTDNLDAVLSGLEATVLPANPCGAGSVLAGTDDLTLTGGNLLGLGSCTFDVTVQVPGATASDSYVNTTSGLEQDLGGQRMSVPTRSSRKRPCRRKALATTATLWWMAIPSSIRR